MIKNYMTYPMKYMRITQTYDGSTSHKPHTLGNPKDYPIDEGGKDSGRDPIYCPCDEMKITAIRGIGSGITNTVWLVSTSAVVTPTFTDQAFMTLTHWNDADLKNKKVGDTFRRGDIICYEGTDGASANHIHITAGRGYSDGWTQSTTGKWVVTGNTMKPEDVFFLDRSFTTELWGGSLAWVILPSEQVGTPASRDTTKNQLEVLVDNLTARKEPSLQGTKLGYIRRGIFNYTDTVTSDGYTWYKVEDFYIAVQPGWANIYSKVEETDTCQRKVEELNTTITNLQQQLENATEQMPPKIFTCPKTGKYIIYLKRDDQLYLKKANV